MRSPYGGKLQKGRTTEELGQNPSQNPKVHFGSPHIKELKEKLISK